jgi:hypothetical protein
MEDEKMPTLRTSTTTTAATTCTIQTVPPVIATFISLTKIVRRQKFLHYLELQRRKKIVERKHKGGKKDANSKMPTLIMRTTTTWTMTTWTNRETLTRQAGNCNTHCTYQKSYSSSKVAGKQDGKGWHERQHKSTRTTNGG